MEEIKVGEYVRTNSGLIDKCETADIDKITNAWVMDFSGIKAHSFNLIDLIEVRDFVNGYKVIEINKEEKYVVADNKDYGEHCIYDTEIKTILTKEQYKRDCYKVKK